MNQAKQENSYHSENPANVHNETPLAAGPEWELRRHPATCRSVPASCRRSGGLFAGGKTGVSGDWSDPEMTVLLRIIQIEILLERLEYIEKISVIILGAREAPKITRHRVPVGKQLEILGDQI